MNKVSGRKRAKLKGTIRSIKHQQERYGISDAEVRKLKELEKQLKEKK